jgi:hypothetical protein
MATLKQFLMGTMEVATIDDLAEANTCVETNNNEESPMQQVGLACWLTSRV